MISKLSGWDDTIVALATAPGLAAIGVVRLSGKDALKIAAKLFPSKNIEEAASHSIHVGLLVNNQVAIDEVVISLFKAPRSYTGENIVEISCHGSPFIQQQVIAACIEKGARLAKPGEFTQRAFLNGKLDLAQAEAVADLIASNTAASQRTALNNVRGGFSNQLKEVRERLIQFAALIELELDFATEDVEFADRAKFYTLLNEAQQTTSQLVDSFRLGNVIKNGVNVAIIGKPNVGKSTLLNRLLNEDRAIVSDIAGTTRDTIEEMLNIEGVMFRLIDTAGIRSHSSDSIENIGIGKSMEKMKTADIVLYIFDVQAEDETTLNEQVKIFNEASKAYLLIANKTDTGDPEKLRSFPGIIRISARLDKGIGELKKKIYESTVQSRANPDNTIISNARHLEALQEVSQSLNEIKQGLDDKLPGDLLALEIRRCLYFLGEITGEITNEDKLDYIFSKFCIGK
jgi:tRNA modification GTPase